MKVSEPPVVVEQKYKAPVEQVWSAISQIDLMRQWFFENIPEFKPQVGFATDFPVQSGERLFTHLWQVTEVIPNRRLVYSWRYREYPGDSSVAFELSEDGPDTILSLTATVSKDFPDGIPEFERNSCIAGWEYFIKDRLRKFLQPGE